jgi:hypothetical protein
MKRANAEGRLADVDDRLGGRGDTATDQLVVQPGAREAAYPAYVRYESRGPLDFFADSAATRHMTHNKTILHNFTPIKAGERTIIGIKGATTDVRGIGDIYFCTKVNNILRYKFDEKSNI